MSVQNLLVSTTVVPIEFFNEIPEDNEYRERIEEEERIIEFLERHNNDLQAEEAALINEVTQLKERKIALFSCVHEYLQSSKTLLQRICAITGAMLGAVLVSGATLALPVVGAALVGRATGYLVGSFIHEKQHSALIQALEDFQAEEETQANQNQ